MSDSSFSYSVRPSSGGNDPDDGGRYLALPFEARAAAGNQALLLAGHDHQARTLEINTAQVLAHCNRLRTLAGHAEHVRARLGLPTGRNGEVRRALETARDGGLLIGEDDIPRHISANASSDDAPATIDTLFVRACRRPDTLARLLTSLGENDTGGLKRCVVLDDSADAEDAQRIAQTVHAHAARAPVELHCIGRDRRPALVAAIAREAGVDEDALQWCIAGDDNDPEPGYGASLNLALLLGAGAGMAMIDDDASLDGYRLEESDDAVRFGPAHDVHLRFPEPGRPPEQQFERTTSGLLDAHRHHLGRPASWLARAGNDHAGRFETLDPQLLHDLSGNPRVRLTSNGTLGDPGTSGIHWLFAEAPDNLRALCESRDRYRALLQQRQVARCPVGVLATPAINLMTTTVTGIDNTALLLPTQPRGANEDLMFGALVSYLHPGSLHLALPGMLFHQRPEPRRWRDEDLDRPRNTNRGSFLAAGLFKLENQAWADDPACRVELLRGWLGNLAALDQSALSRRLQRDLLQLRGDTIDRIQDTRSRLQPPEWLDADMQRCLATLSRISSADHERMAALAATLPAFARRYADCLPAWCAAWHHCAGTGLDHWLETAAAHA